MSREKHKLGEHRAGNQERDPRRKDEVSGAAVASDTSCPLHLPSEPTL